MSLNRYRPHIFVLPEDDANRQIANGFVLHPQLKARTIQILPPAGGWRKAVDRLFDVHIPEMQKFSEERLILAVDLDRSEGRLRDVKAKIPAALQDRVFAIGVLSEPEDLKRAFGTSFEGIGELMASNCYDNTGELWEHYLLKHNRSEVDRLSSSVRPFLFNLDR